MYFSAHIHMHMKWLLQKIPNAALESIYRCSSLLTIAKIRLPNSLRSSWMYRELKLNEVTIHTPPRYSIVFSLSLLSCVIRGWNLLSLCIYCKTHQVPQCMKCTTQIKLTWLHFYLVHTSNFERNERNYLWRLESLSRTKSCKNTS